MVKLVVGNLPPSATNQSLKEIFHIYDDLQDYKLISNYGFVYLGSEQSANHAVHNLNGVEYHGFYLTVDFAGENKNKWGLQTPVFPDQFSRPSIPVHKRLGAPLMEQRNLNPYNIPYPSTNNGSSRSYDASANMYGSQKLDMESRINKSYNPNFPNTNSFNVMSERGYGHQNYGDYDTPKFGPVQYSVGFDIGQEDYYGSPAQYGDYSQQYLNEEFYSSAPPTKRSQINQFMDNDGYQFTPRKPLDFTEDEFRPFRAPQQAWSDLRQMPMRQPLTYPRAMQQYHPREVKMYEPRRSYM